MINLEDIALIPTEATYLDTVVLADSEGQVLLGSIDTVLSTVAGENSVFLQDGVQEGDELIAQMLSSASSDAVALGLVLTVGDVPTDPRSTEEEGEEIVVTGKRLPQPTYYWDGGSSGSSGGSTGGGGGGSAGPTVTAVEQHAKDCGTEDGAAVQVAKHVTGELPAGTAGPPDPMTTSAGNDWTTVEFGAVIVRNTDGSFGALNDMIYSSNLPGYAALPSGAGQPVQGLWHSHPTRGDAAQHAIDRYPSTGDWAALARTADQAGAAANPSLWITGPDGVTREFSLSERGYYESLAADPSRMVDGEGLAGKERAQSCG
ncbi:MAG TPA: hypothetical protein VF535_13400 [Allosphingosinicella sp.]